MKRFLLSAAAAIALLVCCQQNAQAQFVTYYSPVVAPAPTVVYRPVAPVAYYTPAPVTYSVARPVVTTVAPVAVARTRYRPFRGRSVTRVRYGYAPVSYYGW